MKKYIIDPNQMWVKANLHCHTTNSDGEKTPEEIKEMYKAHGYHVVAFTDHEIFYDNSHLSDESFIALTASEYSFVSRDFKPANKTYVDTNARTLWRDLEVAHFNIFKKNPHDTFNFCTSLYDFDIKKCKSKPQIDGYRRDLTIEAINEVIKIANEEGSLVQFNHPDWSLNSESLYLNLKGLWGFELLNYGTELETGLSYSAMAYEQMLRLGLNVFCTMGDDNHNHNGEDDSYGGFNYIGVNRLTYSEVFESLKVGNFYASAGPMINSMYVENGVLYLETSEVSNIILHGYNRRYRYIVGENICKAEFELLDEDIYFHITIKDRFGRVAHTQPYFVKDFKGN